jgi:hypothetical protein
LQAAARVAVEGALAIRPQGGNVGAGR